MSIVKLVAHKLSDFPDTCYLDEVHDRFFRSGELGQSVMGLDFDGTMVEDDTGIQVFLQKLLDPNYWEDGVEDFQQLLLPEDYTILLTWGAQGDKPELNPQLCQMALDLASDIKALYEELKRQQTTGEIRFDVDIEHAETNPLLNEFARKMIALDHIMMTMDQPLSKELNGEFLLRTRFFRNKLIRDIRAITSRVWTHTGRIVNLQIDSAPNVNGHTKKVGREHPEFKNDPLRIRLCPVVDRRTLQLVYQTLRPGDSPLPRVITTNHPVIVDTLIKTSPWNDVLYRLEHAIQIEDPLVRGTKLVRNHANHALGPRAKELPVFGERKRVIAKEVADYHRRRFRIAVGDSPGDLAMGHEAVKNDGVFLVISPRGETSEETERNVEAKRRLMHDNIIRIFGPEVLAQMEKRMFYALPKAA